MSIPLGNVKDNRLKTAQMKTASASLSKWLRPIIALSAIVATSVLPMLAQTPEPQTGPASAAASSSQDADEAQTNMYNELVRLYRLDKAAAYKLAKEYLQKYPQENERTKFFKKWVETHEKSERKAKVIELLREKKYNEAFALGKQILSVEPDDVSTLYNLTNVGLEAYVAGDKDFLSDATNYARKAIKLIETGNFNVPAEDKDRDLGFLNSALGVFFLELNPTESIDYFYRAMHFEAYKNDPSVYFYLGKAILAAECEPLLREFESRFTTPELKESPEARLVTRKWNAAMDRAIDALARAVILADIQPKFASLIEDWRTSLTQLYKIRNNNRETGLNYYIKKILKTPMQKQPRHS